MMHEITIRPYTPVDKSAVLELLKLNIPQYFAPSEMDDFKRYIEQHLEQYFVVILVDKIIGAGGINFADNFKTGKISWDFIHPLFQGKGLGQMLLQHRLDILTAMPHIETIMVRTSQLAYKFYQKNGFVLNELVKDYWEKGFDLYDMRYVSLKN
jgi:[ribosomal protein S18]-alanine N-acetyltransferase